jgi:adenylate cyclase
VGPPTPRSRSRPVATPVLPRGEPILEARAIGEPKLRGRLDALPAFEPLAPSSDPAAIASYNAAYVKLAGDNASATAAFAAHLGAWPNDVLARFHLKRLLNGQRGARIAVE